MLIRSKLVRNEPGVTPPVPLKQFVVEFGKNRERPYVFKLDEKGDHVCDVKHKEDCSALLAITEGYEVHPSQVEAYEAAQEKAAEAAEKEAKEAKAYNAKVDKMKRKELDAEMVARGLESVDGKDATDDDLRGLLRKPVPDAQ